MADPGSKADAYTADAAATGESARPASSESVWKLDMLAAGERDKQVIVTVDFALFSSGPTLGSVLADDNRAHEVLRIDAVSDLADRPGYWSMTELARGYAAAMARLTGSVGLIAAHCNGAVLATHLAAAVTAEGGRPPAVALVAPTWPAQADVYEEFAALRRGLGGPADSVPVISEGQEPAMTLARFDEILRADINVMCDRDGFDVIEREVILDQVAGRYRAWLGFLLASAQSDPVWPGGSLAILIGRGRQAMLPAAMAMSQITVLPTETTDLLSSADVLRRLHALLAPGVP